MKLKPGDKVRCIIADGSHNHLIKDRIYKISLVFSLDKVTLREVSGAWRQDRFRLVRVRLPEFL